MSKIKTVVVFAAGYVLGARAGRLRYEKIKHRAQDLWAKPAVQDRVGRVQEQAGRKVSEQVGKATHEVKQRLPGSSGSTAPGSSTDDGTSTDDHPATSAASSSGTPSSSGPASGNGRG